VCSFLHDDFCCLQIRISPEDLEKERGAVLEEYRLGRDANGRLAELCFASVLQGSKVSLYSNCKHFINLALELIIFSFMLINLKSVLLSV